MIFQHLEMHLQFQVQSFVGESMHLLYFQIGWAKTTRVYPPILNEVDRKKREREREREREHSRSIQKDDYIGSK